MQDKTKVRGNVILMEIFCFVKRKTVNTKPCISPPAPSSPPTRNKLSSCMRLSHKLNNEFYIMGR